MSRRHAQTGFSLIEMLIGMAITAVAVTAAAKLVKFPATTKSSWLLLNNKWTKFAT